MQRLSVVRPQLLRRPPAPAPTPSDSERDPMVRRRPIAGSELDDRRVRYWDAAAGAGVGAGRPRRRAGDCAGRSGPRVALVSGSAGMGKTSVVRAFLAGIDSRVRVLEGACDDLLTPRPLEIETECWRLLVSGIGTPACHAVGIGLGPVAGGGPRPWFCAQAAGRVGEVGPLPVSAGTAAHRHSARARLGVRCPGRDRRSPRRSVGNFAATPACTIAVATTQT
jgi:hypothetical protein